MRSLIGLGAIIIVAACGGAESSGAACPPSSTLTYESFGKAFFAANCNRCHSATTKGQSPLYDDVSSIRASAKQIDQEAASGPNATNDDMPKDAELAKAEREKLGEWLACGAP